MFYLFTQISYIVKTYTTTAREPSIHTIADISKKFKAVTGGLIKKKRCGESEKEKEKNKRSKFNQNSKVGYAGIS